MSDRLILIGLIILGISMFFGGIYFTTWAAKKASDGLIQTLIQLPPSETK
jgi:hypothetical protein